MMFSHILHFVSACWQTLSAKSMPTKIVPEIAVVFPFFREAANVNFTGKNDLCKGAPNDACHTIIVELSKMSLETKCPSWTYENTTVECIQLKPSGADQCTVSFKGTLDGSPRTYQQIVSKDTELKVQYNYILEVPDDK